MVKPKFKVYTDINYAFTPVNIGRGKIMRVSPAFFNYIRDKQKTMMVDMHIRVSDTAFTEKIAKELREAEQSTKKRARRLSDELNLF